MRRNTNPSYKWFRKIQQPIHTSQLHNRVVVEQEILCGRQLQAALRMKKLTSTGDRSEKIDSGLIQPDDFMLQGLGYGFGAAIHMELVGKILEMLFHRINGDITFICNHFIGIPFHKQFQDHGFPVGEVKITDRLLLVPEELKYFLCYKGTHRRTALHHFLQGSNQLHG